MTRSSDEVPVTLITGATRGIGRAAAQLLSENGHTLLIVARDPVSAREMINGLPGAAELLLSDLSSLASVRALAAEVLERHPRLDVLINNAGVVKRRRELTPEGHETTWVVNHLSPFLLSALLMPALSDAGGRIVNVSSEGHRAVMFSSRPVTVDLDNLEGQREFSPFGAYSQAKLANLMTTYVSAGRTRAVCINAVHPGVIRTDITRELPAIRLMHRMAGRSAAEGARGLVHLATAEGVETGRYFDGTRPVPSSVASHHPVLQARVWGVSCEAVGLPLEPA